MTGSRKLARVLAAVGVAGAAAAAGTIGLAAAQSDPTTPSTTAPASSTTAPAKGDAGHPGGPGGRFGPFGGIGGDVLHGEFVVPKNGAFETLDTQVGKVTAVSSSSITVQSDDGFSKTYAVTDTTLVNSARDGIASVKTDATVRVTATVSGSTATAVEIVDHSTIQAQRPKWQPDRPQRPGGSTTTTTTA
jgi:hypothetical protein